METPARRPTGIPYPPSMTRPLLRPFILVRLLGLGACLVLSIAACGDDGESAAPSSPITGGKAGSGGQTGRAGSGGIAGAAGQDSGGASGGGASGDSGAGGSTPSKGGSAGAPMGGSGGSGGAGPIGGSSGAGSGGTSTAGAGGGNAAKPLGLAPIPPRTINENETTTIPIVITGDTPDAPLHLSAVGLPPGAELDVVARAIRFRPDFIQGGGPASNVTIHARRGAQKAETTFALTIANTIVTPKPTVTSTENAGPCQRLVVSQKTDAYLDSMGHAGRTFAATVLVPDQATDTTRMPVSIYLHGAGVSSPGKGSCVTDSIRIYPHDPNNTYWWGYSENFPAGKATTGTVPPYTARRVLALLEWVLAEHHGDDSRVRMAGSSMGGAGAMTIGLLWGRHFSAIEAELGQAIPRSHRAARLASLEPIWGKASLGLKDELGGNVWDRMDLTRAVRDDAEASGPHLFIRHGKDDKTIQFAAVVEASPLTKLTFYQALQTHGHWAVWDEGGHGTEDPVMKDNWWGGFRAFGDPESFATPGGTLPGFSASSLDDDPGDGTGNGKVSYTDSGGYAANDAVAGDTGWKGDIAGAINRHLRWDATKQVDTIEEWSVPLRVYSGGGTAPPKAGYPAKGDQVLGAVPATVSVTVRHPRQFLTRPGETVAWTFGSAKGTATADAKGLVTISALSFTASWQTLTITRVDPTP